MLRQLIIITLLALLFLNGATLGQDQTQVNNQTNKKTLGLSFGSGFFQHIKMNLTDFNQEIISTSDNLVPTNFKANFSYYFTPKVAVRFSSGYGFARQADHGEVDFSRIDSMAVKFKNESVFSMVGFPVETALMFQTAIDKNENFLIHIGIGIGYYTCNYKAEGKYEELNSETNETNWEEEYINPQLSLSGWAQFIMMGLNINLSQKVGASFEISKIGLSFMRVENDIIKQKIYNRELENELKYGYRRQDYINKSGLEDVALSLGIYWKL